jgi:hypothetical protein
MASKAGTLIFSYPYPNPTQTLILVQNGHKIIDSALRTALVNCLPKEMEACKESLQTNIMGKSQSEIIELFRVVATGRRFNDMAPRTPAPTAKAANLAGDGAKSQGSQSKSPAVSRPGTPYRRQQQPSNGNRSGGNKSGGSTDFSSGSRGGSALSRQDVERSLASLLSQLKRHTTMEVFQPQPSRSHLCTLVV